MPTNLPPECRTLERKYFEAQTLPEKIKALEDYHSAIPKHKGTERLRSQIKRKISKLRLELEERKHQKVSASSASGRFSIKKEGAAQVVILGLTNVGKVVYYSVLLMLSLRLVMYPLQRLNPRQA